MVLTSEKNILEILCQKLTICLIFFELRLTWGDLRKCRLVKTKAKILLVAAAHLLDDSTDPTWPRWREAPHRLEHWLDCPDTVQARMEIERHLIHWSTGWIALALYKLGWRFWHHSTTSTVNSHGVSGQIDCTGKAYFVACVCELGEEW